MRINDTELELNPSLTQAIDSIGNKKNNLLYSFGRVFQYADEPKFFQYYAQLFKSDGKNKPERSTASGFSFFSHKLAVLKCLLEAIERYSQKNLREESLIFSKPSKLNKPYLGITDIVSFSTRQRKSNPYLKQESDGHYGWVLGKTLPSLKDIYLPAQLVYLTYKRIQGEPLIRLPISTGAASGTAYSAAIYRGICEIVERDAFMITYLNKLPRKRVPLNKSKNALVQRLLKIVKDYKLQIDSFDITTDLGIYTFFTIVRDKTGIAASLSTGLKSGLDATETLLGSMQEAFHPRTWLRGEMSKFTGNKSELKKPYELSTRGLLWSSPDTFKNLNFLFHNTLESKTIEDYQNKADKSSAKNLQKIVKILNDTGYQSYFVDITPDLPNIRRTSIKVVMTIVPGLQPLYLDERFPYLGGNRLYSVPVTLGYLSKPNKEINLNKFPHPFL